MKNIHYELDGQESVPSRAWFYSSILYLGPTQSLSPMGTGDKVAGM